MEILKYSLLLGILCTSCIKCDVKISTHDIEITKGAAKHIVIEISNYKENDTEINLQIKDVDIVDVTPNVIIVDQPNINVTITVEGIGPGHTTVYANDSNRPDLKDVYFRITVNLVPLLDTISEIIGWIYFASWTVSFYPQIFKNARKKSVVGLNFDYLAYNLVGFTLYSFFNLGLYCIHEIKEEYFARYPRGLIPVKLNDLLFTLHAIPATALTIVQCFMYQRDKQKVSHTARGIITIIALFLLGGTILAFTDVIHWLDLLYFCSYVNLSITLIKYAPQAYMNYKRKSTVGWSIENIYLDFTGGVLSMIQMILDAYNYDDWVSIFGDPTKFGLGLLSVIFDIFFFVQHYFLYRHKNHKENKYFDEHKPENVYLNSDY